jgi:hypothetical protein
LERRMESCGTRGGSQWVSRLITKPLTHAVPQLPATPGNPFGSLDKLGVTGSSPVAPITATPGTTPLSHELREAPQGPLSLHGADMERSGRTRSQIRRAPLAVTHAGACVGSSERTPLGGGRDEGPESR